MGNTIIEGFTEEKIRFLREASDVHIVYRKTGDYRIISNEGRSIGELIKKEDNDDLHRTYNLTVFDNDYDRFFNPTLTNEKVDELKKIAENLIKFRDLKEKTPHLYTNPKTIKSNRIGRIFMPIGKKDKYEMRYSEMIHGSLYNQRRIIRLAA